MSDEIYEYFEQYFQQKIEDYREQWEEEKLTSSEPRHYNFWRWARGCKVDEERWIVKMCSYISIFIKINFNSLFQGKR